MTKLIISLVLLATAALGYFIYPKEDLPQIADSPTLFTTEEIKVLDMASKRDKEAGAIFLALIQKLGKEAPALSIQNCYGQPAVFKTRKGQEFKIKNEDQIDHVINFGEEGVLILPAKSEILMTANPPTGSSIYQYTCDGSGTVNGIILVELLP